MPLNMERLDAQIKVDKLVDYGMIIYDKIDELKIIHKKDKDKLKEINKMEIYVSDFLSNES